MPQCFIEVTNFSSHSHIVVRSAASELGIGFVVRSDEKILQTRREAVDIGALIEIVHNAVELLI